jgi:hypothetical protein
MRGAGGIFGFFPIVSWTPTTTWPFKHHSETSRGSYVILMGCKYRNAGAFHEFVLSGNEEALVKFYSTKRHTPVLGSEEFAEWVRAGKFSFRSYGRVGGACSVIERQVEGDRKLRRRIEQIREKASSTSSQKKT